MNKVVIDIPNFDKVERELSEIREIVKRNINQNLPKYLPANKIADMFEIQKRTLSIYADKGDFKKYYFGKKLLYYKLSEIYDFIANSNLN